MTKGMEAIARITSHSQKYPACKGVQGSQERKKSQNLVEVLNLEQKFQKMAGQIIHI